MRKFHFTKEMIYSDHFRTDIAICGQTFFHGRMGTDSYEKWDKKRNEQSTCMRCDRVLIPKFCGIAHSVLPKIKDPLAYLFEVN